MRASIIAAVCAVSLIGCGKHGTAGKPIAAPAETQPKPAAAKPESDPHAPLRIAYSDWPGWVAWDVATKHGYFNEADVKVELVWLEYVPSIEKFSEGSVDAVCMTNGDALVAGSSGATSVGIVINDYSNGNDMIVARSGIASVAELRGKKVAVEVGFVDHLLLMEALRSAQMTDSDVSIMNAKTHETPALLAAGTVDAIAAWQPNSGRALEDVSKSTAILTSANVPGLIYDLLFVSPKSLQARRADWKKVVAVWFRVANILKDPAQRREAAALMGQRVGLAADKYAKLMEGTAYLDAAENQRRFRKQAGLDSVQGSSETVDRFNVANRVYKDSVAVDSYFDSTLVEEVIAKR